jgi:hypothetical protein
MKTHFLLSALALSFMIFGYQTLKSQNVAINATGATPHADAMLDIASTSKGLLIPRMTTAQRVVIASGTPAAGLQVYDTDLNANMLFDGTAWRTVATTTGLGAYLPLAGGTLTGNLLFTDNTYDIGASGATRPRTAYFGTSIVNPLLIGGTGTTSTLIYKTTTGVGASGADHIFQVGNNGATEAMRILNNGNIGIGVTAPSAYLHLKAGGTAAGTAPLKFTSQAAGLTTVEQGTMELIGNSLQFTQLLKRRGVAMTQSVRTADYTLAASSGTTESAAIETAQHGPDYLEIGKMEEIVLRGSVSQRNNANAKLTIRVKVGPPGSETTVQTVSTTVSTAIAANTPFEFRISATCRTTGATGTIQFNTVFWVDGITNVPDLATLATNINTTVANNIIVTAQWGTDNDVANTFTVNQARVLCIEPNR